MRFYTDSAISPRRHRTPEGFMVCEAVPIARTGTMLYAAGELPLEAGPAGIIEVTRGADELFRPETIASFNGKPVTLDHPPEFVGPDTWRDLAKGTVINCRRGEGAEAEMLLADLLITDARAIDEIESGRREVSCGYDAAYRQDEPGRASQTAILGNHVALVARGRCGPRCAIGDKENPLMSVWTKLRDAFKTRDAKAFDEAVSEAEQEAENKDGDDEAEKQDEGKTQDAVMRVLDGLSRRLDAMDARLRARDAEAEKDDATKDGDDEEEGETARTGDAAPVPEAAFRAVVAAAEVLAPGLHAPTFDAKAKPAATRDALCDCQRRALVAAYSTADGRKAIDPFLAGAAPDFLRMPAPTVDMVFRGAAALAAQRNNGGIRPSGGASTFDRGRNAPSPADINRIHREAWAKRA